MCDCFRQEDSTAYPTMPPAMNDTPRSSARKRNQASASFVLCVVKWKCVMDVKSLQWVVRLWKAGVLQGERGGERCPSRFKWFATAGEEKEAEGHGGWGVFEKGCRCAMQCVVKYYCYLFSPNFQCVTQATGGLASVETAQVDNETKCLLCAAEVGQVLFLPAIRSDDQMDIALVWPDRRILAWSDTYGLWLDQVEGGLKEARFHYTICLLNEVCISGSQFWPLSRVFSYLVQTFLNCISPGFLLPVGGLQGQWSGWGPSLHLSSQWRRLYQEKVCAKILFSPKNYSAGSIFLNSFTVQV